MTKKKISLGNSEEATEWKHFGKENISSKALGRKRETEKLRECPCHQSEAVRKRTLQDEVREDED